MREQYVEAFPRRRWFAVTTTGLSATNAVGVPNLDNWAKPITPAASTAVRDTAGLAELQPPGAGLRLSTVNVGLSTKTFYIWNTFRFSVAHKFPYSFNFREVCVQLFILIGPEEMWAI